MAQGIEEIRQLALESEAAKSASENQEKINASSVASQDMHIWLDAIERAIARKEQKLTLFYDPHTDYDYQREGAKEKAPKLTEWSRFCTRSSTFQSAYAETVQGLLGAPFGVRFVSTYTKAKRPDWRERYTYWYEIRWDGRKVS